jgi:hypothetical protein
MTECQTPYDFVYFPVLINGGVKAYGSWEHNWYKVQTNSTGRRHDDYGHYRR